MLLVWVGFVVFVLILLALDLGVFHRTAHVVQVKEALIWSAVWITLALLFTVFVYFTYEHHWLGVGTAIDAADGTVNDGASAVAKYLTGYVVEKSLSVDNIFVIVLVFGSFAVPAIYQHRVLFWGILGALLMRGAMIAVGAQLISRFHWILYLFGAFLLFTAGKMLMMKDGHADPGSGAVVRFARRLFPVTDTYHGAHFVVRGDGTVGRAGALMLTPLALALIVVEITDLIFAVDSIPAIFAITADPFLVFTSNVFAILGLRSLYFALAGMMDKFRYLKVSLAIVLAIIGAKMIGHSWLGHLLGEHAELILLAVILSVLTVGIGASALANRRAGVRAVPSRS